MMGGICAIIDSGAGHVDEPALRAILGAGTFDNEAALTWRCRGVALAGAPGAWSTSGAVPALASAPSSAPFPVPAHSSAPESVVVADARLDGRSELVADIRSSLARLSPGPAFGIDRDLDRCGAPDLILLAHKVWGDEAPARLIGDFAYILWDGGARKLHCVRDALGVRPLHYALTADRSAIVVASEARMVAAHPQVPIKLDRAAAIAHLSLRMSDDQRTILEGIRAVPPAHRLEIDLATTPQSPRASLRRYWQAPLSREHWREDPEEGARRLRQALMRSVADRLDGFDGSPIGILLSGGLDSGSIAALTAGSWDGRGGQGPGLGPEPKPGMRPGPMHRPEQTVAFSYAFRTLTQCDETGPAKRLATRYGFPIYGIDVEDHWLLQDEDAFRPALDQPFTAWASVSSRVLDAAQKRGIRLLLTGHGGDNMVSGSPLAYASLLMRGRIDRLSELISDAERRGISPALMLWSSALRPLLPDFLARGARGLAGRGPAWRPPPWLRESEFSGLSRRGDSVHGVSVHGATVPEALGRDASRHAYDQSERPSEAAAWSRDPAVRAARDQALVLGSVGRAIEGYRRMAADYGIDVRHPFVDRRIVEVVLSIPPEQHYQNGRTKALLRRALRDDLPKEYVDRADKTDFGPYLDHSLRTVSAGKIEALFDRPIMARIGLVDAGVLAQAFDAYRAGRLPFAGNALWAAITFELWLREHGRVLGLID